MKRLAALVVLLLGAVVATTSATHADLSNTYTTTTAVVPDGTLVFSVTSGATITASPYSSECPMTGLNTASVTYHCRGATGIPTGKQFAQSFAGASGPITETVTYNANGPVTHFPGVDAETLGNGTCSIANPTYTCTVSTGPPTVPGGWLKLDVTAGGAEKGKITDAPATLGVSALGLPGSTPALSPCSLRTVVPTPFSDAGGKAEVGYTCDVGQSIPSGTTFSVSLAISAASGTLLHVPEWTVHVNSNAPIATTLGIPAPTRDTVQVGSLPTIAAPTLTNINPSSGPTGTAVMLTGTNLGGATQVSFGATAATVFDCSAGTSCTATAPSSLTVDVAYDVQVTTPAGPSNTLPFTVRSATTATTPAPVLTNISPATGTGGSGVTLTGTNLNGATAVSFSTTAATAFTCAAAGTSCTATAPTLAAGTSASVTVTTAGGPSNALTFTYASTPSPGGNTTPGTGNTTTPTTGNTTTPTSGNTTSPTTGSTTVTSPATSIGSTAITGTAASGPGTSSSSDTSGAAGGISVTYAAGWNIASGPANTIISGAVGPLYAFPAGSSDYQVTPSASPLQSGQGYWAYFDADAAVTIVPPGPQSTNVVLPAGQWTMIGNPGSGPATIAGADIVYVYSAATGYQATATLGPGQGGWAYAANGGTVTVSAP